MKYLVFIWICAIITSKLTSYALRFLTYNEDPCTYCDGKHVACNISMRFQDKCYTNVQVEPMPLEMRNFILDKHNGYRNLIAGGSVTGYSSAIRMASLTWNIEFEYLSLLNLLQCEMAHDKCRRTPDYPYAGQNLAFFKWRGYNFTTEEVLTRLFGYWFDELKYATMADINAYPTRSLPMIGHFTLLVQERATQVGCSIITQISVTNIKELFFACDYSFTNVYGIQVYRPGPSASSCQTGRNPKYPNLCSLYEKYNTSFPTLLLLLRKDAFIFGFSKI